ncbi:MAG TPA: dTDP-4-dehydrorhamnose 3,5-epimerase [Collinsella ihuae]|uniref:dTDP-4-dehydrorhamnose 3,5-epimerase n=1 Tax=Collinsella ihumii TaxID=1720204 RepID=A0A921LS92_9ACTN|nr:dTDP-4-dehydrorhamnose 3,5-epimerase [Collinsella ihumii]
MAQGDTITSGNFTFTETSIEGVIIVDVKSYGDERGYFMETYKKPDFVKGGIDVDFVQDNQSSSTKGVLRGLHFQINHPQSKLVRVVSGEVFDVAVDLREGSPTYGKWEGVILSAENKRQFFIPRGFAHGFLVLSDAAEFCYKCDDIYHPNDEGGLMWNDSELNINWPINELGSARDVSFPILSAKDRAQKILRDMTGR